MPREVVKSKAVPYMRNGKPIHRMERSHDSPFSIVEQHQAEYRGLVEYYRMAYNLHRLNYLKWIMETSLTKTLWQDPGRLPHVPHGNPAWTFQAAQKASWGISLDRY